MRLCFPQAKKGEISERYGKLLATLEKLGFEPVGRDYELHFSPAAPTVVIESEEEEEDSLTSLEESPEDFAYLRSLDPRLWKDQDHYRVLSLQHKRVGASDREIKAAFRRKVLIHHPDKRASRGEKIDKMECDYFSCITRAYELLSNPKQRRAYDSIDPEFDNSIPSVTEKSKANFFDVFRPVFERNAGWSINSHVPPLGDENSTEEEVESFYNFWYNIQSWREYSYKDETEKNQGENRYERRYIEKENRMQRQKLKKEEMKRIRQLVENAQACDPRIKKFKEAAKAQKEEAKKRRKDEANSKRLAEEQERRDREEAERTAKEEKLKAEQAVREKDKKQREALKKEQKKAKKLFEALCAEADNFADVDSAELVKNLENIDRCIKVLSLDQLTLINDEMKSAENRRPVFEKAVKLMEDKLEEERMNTLRSSMKSVSVNGSGASGSSGTSTANEWPADELQLLIKAVNLFPAGTVDRWDVVATYIGQHSERGVTRTAKDVLCKAKSIQKNCLGLKQGGGSCTANLNPTEAGEETIQGIDQAKLSSFSEVERAWTNEEQKLLEQALRTYPVTLGTERWDKIAECLPDRTKKECMKRFKDIVATVKAKKAAIAATKAPK